MQPMTEAVWLATAFFAALAVLGFLHMLASGIKYETKIHNLRIEVIEARNRYVRHIRGDDELGEVDVIEDDQPEPEREPEPNADQATEPAEPAAAA